MNDKWNKNVPSEISPYLQDNDVSCFGPESIEISEKDLAMIDLFCGAGGFSIGCEWAGFTPVLGIDHFKPAMSTWSHNHPNALGYLGDIRKLSPKQIHDVLRKKGVEKISLLTGGVPCQGFSIANRKHNDNDERNFLFLEYMKYVQEFSPDFLILENVSGLRYTAGGAFEKNIIEAMEGLGYIVKVKLLNAADYGVPQYRYRLIFVGIKSDLPTLSRVISLRIEVFQILKGGGRLDLHPPTCRNDNDLVAIKVSTRKTLCNLRIDANSIPNVLSENGNGSRVFVIDRKLRNLKGATMRIAN